MKNLTQERNKLIHRVVFPPRFHCAASPPSTAIQLGEGQCTIAQGPHTTYGDLPCSLRDILVNFIWLLQMLCVPWVIECWFTPYYDALCTCSRGIWIFPFAKQNYPTSKSWNFCIGLCMLKIWRPHGIGYSGVGRNGTGNDNELQRLHQLGVG